MSSSRSPLNGHFVRTPGAGVVATERCGLLLAALVARNGRIEELSTAVDRHYGIALPRGPFRTALGGHAFLGISRDSWLIISGQERSLEIELRNLVGDTASVVDQSDAHAVLQLSGPKLRDALLKMLPLDLHHKSFPVGHVASSVASHVAVRLWRLDDAPDGGPVFELAVGRSFVRTFWAGFCECSGEFGVTGVSASRSCC